MYVLDIMNHMRSVKGAMAELGGAAYVSAVDFTLNVAIGDRRQVLYPQFTQLTEGKRSYTAEFCDAAFAFNGWYASLNKAWEISSEKLKFKALMQKRGCRTPAYTFDASARPKDVIIKQTCSSFGDGLRGPFREVGESVPDSLLKDGEYYEQFVFGLIAKIWYWNDKPICLKLREMPVMTADGSSTVRELLERERGVIEKYYPEDWLSTQDWDFLDHLLRFQGAGPDDVPPQGRRILLDYRFNNCWLRMSWANDNVLPTCEIAGLREQLEDIGRLLWLEIPEDIRDQTIFTVDAILDARDCLWFLEMNSNPQVHPDVYQPMMRDLFGRSQLTDVTGEASREAPSHPESVAS